MQKIQFKMLKTRLDRSVLPILSIIEVIGKMLPYNFLIQRLQSHWRIYGELKLIDIWNGYYLVKLPSKEDQARVLFEGPWIIIGITSLFSVESQSLSQMKSII